MNNAYKTEGYHFISMEAAKSRARAERSKALRQMVERVFGKSENQ